MSEPFDPDPSDVVNRDESLIDSTGGGGGGGTGPAGPQGPPGPAGNLGGQSIYNFVGAVNNQLGAYTLTNGDTGKIVQFAATLTLNADAPQGTNVVIVQTVAGSLPFGLQAGATMVNKSAHTKLSGQWAVGSLYVKNNAGGTAEWVLAGDTA